jgi:hypothetical protein
MFMMSCVFYYMQSYFLLHVKHVDHMHSNVYNVMCVMNYHMLCIQRSRITHYVIMLRTNQLM